MIAHRLNTLKDCDQIYIMEKGSIIGQGRYKELINKNKQFRDVAEVIIDK
jgi:ATP-binding cassette, subfamily B, bacterial PglK